MNRLSGRIPISKAILGLALIFHEARSPCRKRSLRCAPACATVCMHLIARIFQIRAIFGLGMLLIAAGCAPELGRTLPVPVIPEPEFVAAGDKGAEAVRLKVGNFDDARPAQTLILIDGRNVDSEGPIARVVQDAFTRYLRQAGARIVILNAPTIEGQIVAWSAKVDLGFPTSVGRAVARIKVTVRDSRAQPIYHATFSGESTKEHPILDEEDVKQLLGQAMGIAIDAAVRDRDFITQLSNGRIS